MQPTFILSCESTIDLPYSYVQERELPVLFYSYSVDGEAHVDDMAAIRSRCPASISTSRTASCRRPRSSTRRSMRISLRRCSSRATCSISHSAAA